MIEVKYAEQTKSGEWRVAVHTCDVPSGTARGLYQGIQDFERTRPVDAPLDQVGPYRSNETLCWVRLRDVCAVEVLHVQEQGGKFYAAVKTGDVPDGARRSDNCGGMERLKARACIVLEHVGRGCYTAACAFPCFVLLSDLPAVGQSPAPGSAAYEKSVKETGAQLVDGLTRAECLTRYTNWQGGDKMFPPDAKGVVISVRPGTPDGPDLTAAQLAAAKEEWSLKLRAKVAASDADAKRRDREQVQIQIDPDDL